MTRTDYQKSDLVQVFLFQMLKKRENSRFLNYSANWILVLCTPVKSIKALISLIVMYLP